MADPLSVGAGVVGIVAAGIHSIRELVEFIDGIQHAPEAVSKLRTDLNDIGTILQDLQSAMSSEETAETIGNVAENTKLSPAIKTLTKTCNQYSKQLAAWTKHSKDGHTSFRDKFRVSLEKNKIAIFSQQLNSCKQTVNIALGSCNVQGQWRHEKKTEEIRTMLAEQAKTSKEAIAEMRSVVVDLREREQQLSLARSQADDDDDDELAESAKIEQEFVEQTRRAVSQYLNVCEWIAKQSVAIQTGQEIGDVDIGEGTYAAVGMSNIGKILGIKQKIGNVKISSNSRAFVGMHNNVDHGAAYR